MKLNDGDVRVLASKIQEALWLDLSDRKGVGDELDGCDEEVRAEMQKTHKNLIASEVKKFFA